MTLGQAATRLGTRFGVDLDAEIDTTSNDAMTTALMEAANAVARASYFLWTWKTALTLLNNETEYNTLAAAVSALPVFHVYHVHINGNWLEYYKPDEFMLNFPNYYSATASDKPTAYTLHAPSHIRLAVPATTAAAAASDNFVAGFRLHTTYTWASNQNTELEGPAEYHDLIVDRATLDNTVSYVAGTEGYARRQMIEDRYDTQIKEYKRHNLALYKPIRRSGSKIGSTRRVVSLGFGGGIR